MNKKLLVTSAVAAFFTSSALCTDALAQQSQSQKRRQQQELQYQDQRAQRQQQQRQQQRFDDAQYKRMSESQRQRREQQQMRSQQRQQQPKRNQVSGRQFDIQGRVVQTKQVDIRQSDTPNLVALVATQNNQRVLVDLGPAKRVDVSEGDRISAQGQGVKMGDYRVLIAEKAKLNGSSQKIKRTEQEQQHRQQQRAS